MTVYHVTSSYDCSPAIEKCSALAWSFKGVVQDVLGFMTIREYKLLLPQTFQNHDIIKIA
jgi:hypothetical protein